MQIIPFIKNFIDTYFNFSQDEHLSIKERKAISLTNLISFILCVYLFVLGSSLLFTKYYYIGIFDYSLLLLFIANYFIFLKFKNLALASHITVILYSIIILYLMIFGGIDGTGSLWTMMFPIIATQAIGHKIGTIYSCIILLICSLLLHKSSHLSWFYDYSMIYKDPTAVNTRLMLVYSCIMAISFASTKNKHDLYEEIEETNTAKHTFFINLAHETKTPLTLIRNSLDDYIKHHEPSENLTIIKQNIDKLQRDMVNYLDIQKLENQQLFYNHDQVTELKNIIEQKAQIIQSYLAKKNLTLNMELNVDQAYVNIDPEAFDRILNNLLDNAVKYNRQNGTIAIIINVVDDTYELSVKDSGRGLPESELSRLFDPYYQMSHVKRNTQGLGMGLSIVKEIIDSVAGTITVTSTLHEGSCFTIILKKTLPPASASLHDHYEISMPFELSYGNDISLTDSEYDPSLSTILIVEDNKALLTYLINNLNDSYNIYYALNGKDALTKLKTIVTPDIILSDIMMDTMNGYDLKKELNKNSKLGKIPFVFLTAKSSEKDRMTGLAMGAIDFISKPFSLDELLYKIQAIKKINNALDKTRIDEVSQIVIAYLEKNNPLAEIPMNKKMQSPHLNDTLLHKYNITSQELTVASMLVEGLLYKEIAYELDISINTVRTYIKRLYKKLEINSVKELMNIFRDYKFLNDSNKKNL